MVRVRFDGVGGKCYAGRSETRIRKSQLLAKAARNGAPKVVMEKVTGSSFDRGIPRLWHAGIASISVSLWFPRFMRNGAGGKKQVRRPSLPFQKRRRILAIR